MEKYEYIKLKRKEKGIKQKDLAELIGITISEMSKIETGNRKLSIDIFGKINKILKFNENELKNIFKIDADGLAIYNSYASNLDKIFTYNEVGYIETLSKDDLIVLKNFIRFISDKKISNEEKNAVNTLIKSLRKNI